MWWTRLWECMNLYWVSKALCINTYQCAGMPNIPGSLKAGTATGIIQTWAIQRTPAKPFMRPIISTASFARQPGSTSYFQRTIPPERLFTLRSLMLQKNGQCSFKIGMSHLNRFMIEFETRLMDLI